MALRNVVHRRNHKERAQPGHRRKLGLLEKHKDYVERARDHHSKRDRLQRLQQKAALRNADEFNFGMIKAGAGRGTTSAAEALLHKRKGAGGVVRGSLRRPDASLDNDVVSLLKTQDLGYVRTAIRNEEKKMAQLRQDIVPSLGFVSRDWLQAKEGREEVLARQGLLQSGSSKGKGKAQGASLGTSGKKTVWVDSVDEARSFTAGSSSGKTNGKSKDEYSLDLDDDWDLDLDSMDEDSDADVPSSSANGSAASEKRLGRLVSELASRQARLDALNEARHKLETVRSLLTTRGQSTTKKISGAKAEALKDAVARGKMTSNGLALPGIDDDDESEDEDGGYAKKKEAVIFKWGKERKR